MTDKSKFALFFGNRGNFPASLQAEARKELPKVLEAAGHEVIMLDEELTRYGAIETHREGKLYADFLYHNRGNFDGVILSLPNFGDENGAVVALKDANVPILVQAYPDEFDRMGPALRRDAYCGKVSVMNGFFQNDIKFTAIKPHTISPSNPRFLENIDHFDRVCRVVKGFRNLVIGAIGARTTPFKTVRFDEVALQRSGITVETFDLSNIFKRVNSMTLNDPAVKEKIEALQAYSSWKNVPSSSLEKIAYLGVALDELIADYQLDGVAIRCWVELQEQLGISPCVLMGLLNNTGTAAACEVDVMSAITMTALRLASGKPATILDWNNNYHDEDDKCILFHCGPVPSALMKDSGYVSDHLIIANSLGKNHSVGCVMGRMAPMNFTFSNMMTDSGRIKVYLGDGRFTDDPIPENYFGAAGVAEIDKLQDVLLFVGRNGHRHHVCLTPGDHVAPVKEAFENYLGFEVAIPQKCCH